MDIRGFWFLCVRAQYTKAQIAGSQAWLCLAGGERYEKVHMTQLGK